jgi:hypothetical protein
LLPERRPMLPAMIRMIRMLPDSTGLLPGTIPMLAARIPVLAGRILIVAGRIPIVAARRRMPAKSSGLLLDRKAVRDTLRVGVEWVCVKSV